MEKVHLPQILEHQYADSVIYVKYKQNKKEPTELVTFYKKDMKRSIKETSHMKIMCDLEMMHTKEHKPSGVYGLVLFIPRVLFGALRMGSIN
jgi:hypothetical protein